MTRHLLAGCSFTDPEWQPLCVPWSVEYAKTYPSYIVAKAGMGIKGICIEALYTLQELDDISTVFVMLPTLWRMDIEADEEGLMCNAMVNRLIADQDWKIDAPAHRKWIVSGGLNYAKKTPELVTIFDFLYKHQGFLVLAKEHFRALKVLQNACKERNIKFYVTAIQDPMQQLVGLNHIHDEFCALLDSVDYPNWFRFNGQFVNQFLGRDEHSIKGWHPDTEEHRVLCKYIIDNLG
jgi:hypothetical protein